MSESPADLQPPTDAESATAQAETPSTESSSDAAASIDALALELEHTKRRLAEVQEQSLRVAAEMQNVRRRTERDIENAHKFALEKFASDLLPVVDSLERGLQVSAADDSAQAMREGVELTLRMLTDALRRHGLEPVDAVGSPFDPSRHEAMSMQPSAEHPANTVMAILQKGWMLNGRLLRPAMVIVSRGA